MMHSAFSYLWNARKAILAALGAAITAYTAVVTTPPVWLTVVIAALASAGVVYAVPNKPLPGPPDVTALAPDKPQ